ncbi:MAG TPA: hypothetical protein VGK67_40565 [Myxococcales bacterium]|jgi:hypothetical protein
MKRGVGVVLAIGGGMLFLLGLLFVVGAAGQGSRYLVGAVGLGAGAVLLGFGIRWFRAADADAPEQILAELLAAAGRRNGELSEMEIGAALGKRAALAVPLLEKLVAQHLCERQGSAYVFKDLQPKLFVRKCQFCGAETSIASLATKCPRCGGDIDTRAERKDVGEGGVYRMDE